MVNYFQGSLFPEIELGEPDHFRLSGHEEGELRKKHILNLHLHNGFPTEGNEGLPLVQAYNGPLPPAFIAYSARNSKQYDLGLHGFIYDYKIDPIWNAPSKSLPCFQRYSCAIAPDFSLFVDQPKAVNVWNLYRNRWQTSYWQNNSVNVIPSASWGNVDSFEYCFDGLPMNSTIAIGHIVIGKDKYYKKLYHLGVEKLIERKNPTRLIVYGAPLDFDPCVPVVYYEGDIQKFRTK